MVDWIRVDWIMVATCIGRVAHVAVNWVRCKIIIKCVIYYGKSRQCQEMAQSDRNCHSKNNQGREKVLH